MRQRNALLLPLVLCAWRPLLAADCNANGVEDALDLTASPFGFDPVQVSGTPARPYQVALADMDADGDLDFLTLSREFYTVTVARNQGDGTIGSLASLELEGMPLDLATADFDRDGFADAAVAKENHPAIMLLRSDGLGRLGQPTQIKLEVIPSRLAALDLDGDQDPDLAAVAPFAILPFRNTGAGFTPLPQTRIGSNPVALAAADLDADGDVDVASANALPDPELPGNISLLGNDGTGGFAPPRNLAAGRALRAIIALDLDGDGRHDLAAAGAGLQAFWNGEGGSLEPGEEETAAGGPIADLGALGAGAGGTVDLVAAVEEPASLRRLVNTGQRSFTPGATLSLEASPRSLAIGDLDGDSGEEVVVVEAMLSVVDVEDDRFSRRASLSAGSQPGAIEAFDMDLDGDPDLVAADDLSERRAGISIFRNGDGGFAAGPVATLEGIPYRLAVIDLDGDAYLDPVVTVHEGRMAWLKNGRGMELTPGAAIEIGDNITALAGGDIDRDGDHDLLAGTENDGLVVFRQLAGGTFAERQDYAMDRRFPYSTFVIDLDGDGHLDAVSVTGDTHSLVIHWNDGGGGFSTSATLPAGSYPLQAVPLDLDGDGSLDVAAVNYGSESVTTFLNGGGRSLTRGPAFAAARSGMAIAAADFDGDGKPDLAAAGETLTVLRNTGAGFEPPATVSKVDGHTVRLAVADLDKSGTPEIAMAVKGSRGSGITLFSNSSRPAVSADLNGNGIPDECEGSAFHRGDADANGTLNLTDALAILGHLFLGRAEPGCREAADVDNGGGLDLTDGVRILQFLFLGGPPPQPPGPPPSPCGIDPDPPGSSGDLGCARYAGCP